jgi:hypothetical protein
MKLGVAYQSSVGTRLRHEAGQPEPLDEIVSALI